MLFSLAEAAEKDRRLAKHLPIYTSKHLKRYMQLQYRNIEIETFEKCHFDGKADIFSFERFILRHQF